MAGARRGHGPSVQRLLSNGRLRFWEKGDTGATLVPITEMQVKAVIARPGINESIAAGTTYRMAGAAWTSERGDSKVELSTDEVFPGARRR